jgi:hypothetical protein
MMFVVTVTPDLAGGNIPTPRVSSDVRPALLDLDYDDQVIVIQDSSGRVPPATSLHSPAQCYFIPTLT